MPTEASDARQQLERTLLAAQAHAEEAANRTDRDHYIYADDAPGTPDGYYRVYVRTETDGAPTGTSLMTRVRPRSRPEQDAAAVEFYQGRAK